MDLSTVDNIPGREIARNLGLVVGSSKLGGGGTNNVESTSEDAVNRMIAAAEHIGADGVIGINFRPMMSETADSYAAMFVYGTAVKLAEQQD